MMCPVFVVFALFVVTAGCACPHRKALTTQTLEWFENRADGLVARESWRDQEGGGGFFLFADPTVQAMTAIHTNQWALGGGSAFAAGSFGILVDSNLVPAIAATGTAAGNVVGAAVKTAVK
ncbi:MAG: hypothetical protein ABSA83_07235 [Verrucomicrobiota bacterium]